MVLRSRKCLCGKRNCKKILTAATNGHNQAAFPSLVSLSSCFAPNDAPCESNYCRNTSGLLQKASRGIVKWLRGNNFWLVGPTMKETLRFRAPQMFIYRWKIKIGAFSGGSKKVACREPRSLLLGFNEKLWAARNVDCRSAEENHHNLLAA